MSESSCHCNRHCDKFVRCLELGFKNAMSKFYTVIYLMSDVSVLSRSVKMYGIYININLKIDSVRCCKMV